MSLSSQISFLCSFSLFPFLEALFFPLFSCSCGPHSGSSALNPWGSDQPCPGTGGGARLRDPQAGPVARRPLPPAPEPRPVPCPLKVSIHSVWLGNSITPLREEEWDEEEEEEAEAPAPPSPPTSPVNSRFPLPSVQASGSSDESLVWGPLEMNLSSLLGEIAGNTGLESTSTPVRNFCLSCTVAGSCRRAPPGGPPSS